jgi:HSP20 family protein
MAMVRYEPWNLVARLQDDINRTFSDWSGNETSAATADWIPAADVDEYVDRFELFVDLPGVDPKAVEITLEGGVLTLSGERRVERAAEPISHSRRERGSGRFHRRFILPDSVDADRVNARGRNGVLEITIPKQAAAQPRRIEVAA